MAEDSDDKAYIAVEGRCIGLKSGSEFTPLGNFNFTIKHFVGGGIELVSTKPRTYIALSDCY